MGFEKAIYGLVKRNPKLKNIIRDLYQLMFFYIPKKQEIINDSLKVREGFFFGFHDKIPWSPDNQFLLANKFNIPNRKINSSDTMEVGIFKGKQFDEFKPLAVTRTFNWQQGCMLQWVGNKNNFIYNDFDGNHHISVMRDMSGKIINTFTEPISAIDPTGTYALSYNFARLAKYAPGYGYENGMDPEINTSVPSAEGLNLIDLHKNKVTRLFTVKDIAGVNPDKTMENAFHYFTHGLFSPSGKRFVFYHRWIRDMNFVNTRMFSCNLDGSDLFQFPTDGMVSHIGWQDEEHLLAYCKTVKYGDAYILFHDRHEEYEHVGKGILTVDGHPSYSPANNRFFITDTYPDRYRLSTLILIDHLKNKRIDLLKLKQPLQFKNELRCDFHPRWNREGNLICFDSAHSGRRSLCTIDISDVINSLVHD